MLFEFVEGSLEVVKNDGVTRFAIRNIQHRNDRANLREALEHES